MANGFGNICWHFYKSCLIFGWYGLFNCRHDIRFCISIVALCFPLRYCQRLEILSLQLLYNRPTYSIDWQIYRQRAHTSYIAEQIEFTCIYMLSGCKTCGSVHSHQNHLICGYHFDWFHFSIMKTVLLSSKISYRKMRPMNWNKPDWNYAKMRPKKIAKHFTHKIIDTIKTHISSNRPIKLAISMRMVRLMIMAIF